MKPTTLILVAAVVSVAASIGTSILLAPDEDVRRLDREQALADRLRDADGLMERLNAQIADLEDVVRRNERAAATDGLQDDLVRQIADLRARLDSERPAGLQVTLPDGREFETPVEALDRYLEALVQNEVDRRTVDQRRREFSRFMPFAKVGFLRQIDRTARRLKLDEEQTRRLHDSVSTAFDTAYPQIGVLLDPSRSQEERDTAMGEVEGTFAGVTSEAQSYMQPEQVEELSGMQQQLSQGLTTLQTLGSALGGAGGAGAPGATPPPAGGSGSSQEL